MQKYEILGIKISSFKKDGEIIKYCKLYVAYDEENIEGKACEALSVKQEFIDGLKPGDIVYVFYNKFGKVASVSLVD